MSALLADLVKDPITRGQQRGPIRPGPKRPAGLGVSAAYSPAHAERNEAIGRARDSGLAVTPGSGLAKFLAEAPRHQRRVVLAGLQSRNPRRKARLQREALTF